ncbi:DUF4010 domain-containing protein [Myxococcota bacterium]|nr:DUF4010 domain-containing protein [Myxococcota bacterium]
MSPELETFRNFGIALFIGALVGVEREKRKEREVGGLGGLRTFILVALAGGMAAFLGRALGSGWIFFAGLLALGLLLAAAHHAEVTIDRTAVGATTEVAAVVVYLLGGAAILGHVQVAVALAIATSAVLALKQTLHDAVGRVDLDDFIAGLKLLFASFIVLPLLPNEPVDPLGALNPYKLWLLVVLVSGLSLAGYVAVRWLGQKRGTAVMGLAGGLVSSTAVTLAFARRSREEPGGERALAIGVLLAWTIMFGRVVAAVAVVSPAVVPSLAPPMALMGAVAGLTALLAARGSEQEKGSDSPEVKVKNPFSLISAAKFGAFFAAILMIVALARRYLDDSALLVVSAIAGATDVDAIALSLARLVPAEITPELAARGIVFASISNTVVKAGIVAVLGSRAYARRIVLSTLALCVGAGVAVLVGL